MIDKVALVLGYYLAQPLVWAVAVAAALIVARYPGWRLGFAVAAVLTYVWLMMIALVRYDWVGIDTIAKSYLPVALVASAVSLFVVRAARTQLRRGVA